MIIRDITSAEYEEIGKLSKKAHEVLQTEKGSNNETSLISLLKTHINTIKDTTKDTKMLEQEAFTFGSLYGKMIEEKCGWKWIHVTENQNKVYAVASSNNQYCCQVHNYFYMVLSTSKVNNIELLYNMILELKISDEEAAKYIFLN